MDESRPEFFPPIDELQEQRRANAGALIGRIQETARMAQEFCNKMRALGYDPASFGFGDGSTMEGFVIPATITDSDGASHDVECFVGENGYVAEFRDGRVQTPTVDDLRIATRVDEYRVAMLRALHLEVVARGERPFDLGDLRGV